MCSIQKLFSVFPEKLREKSKSFHVSVQCRDTRCAIRFMSLMLELLPKRTGNSSVQYGKICDEKGNSFVVRITELGIASVWRSTNCRVFCVDCFNYEVRIITCFKPDIVGSKIKSFVQKLNVNHETQMF